MKHKALTVLCASLVIASVGHAQDDACKGQSNAEQTQCLDLRLEKLNQELERVYQRALTAMPEKSNTDRRKEREQLRKSQAAWKTYVHENCLLEGGLEGGSNLWVTHFALVCKEKETKDRIETLKGIAGAEKGK